MKIRFLPILITIVVFSFTTKVLVLFDRFGKNWIDYKFQINSVIIEDAQAASTKDPLPSEPAAPTQNESSTGQGASQVSYVNLNDKVYSTEELEILKHLASRREELDKREKNVIVKENLLHATEKKIDNKIAELKTLKMELQELIQQYSDKENLKIKSLVKIYENMKPKDAAKIFDELEMHILLQVIGAMKEAKVAPILSAMNPVKARDLSTEFAKQKKSIDTNR